MQWIKQALSPLIGQQGERLAKRYLEKHGQTFVAQNYRCRKGEIDLIMREKDTLVFVEVKFRSKAHYGNAIEYFHANKRRKFESAIANYLHQAGLNPSLVAHRIDLVGIELNANGAAQYTWLQNV